MLAIDPKVFAGLSQVCHKLSIESVTVQLLTELRQQPDNPEPWIVVKAKKVRILILPLEDNSYTSRYRLHIYSDEGCSIDTAVPICDLHGMILNRLGLESDGESSHAALKVAL